MGRYTRYIGWSADDDWVLYVIRGACIHRHLSNRKWNWSIAKLAALFKRKYPTEYTAWRAYKRLTTGEK